MVVGWCGFWWVDLYEVFWYLVGGFWLGVGRFLSGFWGFRVVLVSGLCVRFRKVFFHVGCWLVGVWVTGFFPRFNWWLVGAAGSVPRFNLFASSSFAISTMLGFWIVGLVG